MRRYKNAKAALRDCLDAGVRSASAIYREEKGDLERGRGRERKGKVISGWWCYLVKEIDFNGVMKKEVMMKVMLEV